jgi:hypothetical protein
MQLSRRDSMEYTVHELAKLAGITPRTLRYYDEIGLLKPARIKIIEMYVDDERFTAYYNKIAPGCAAFLRDAMRIYTGIKDYN